MSELAAPWRGPDNELLAADASGPRGRDADARGAPLGVVRALATRLNASGLRYCHWKSNWALDESVSGGTDLDVLVHRDDAAQFRAIAVEVGFAPVHDVSNAPFGGVEHMHAIDPDTSTIAHLHAYFRIVTGQSLVKNHRLRIEEMLLETTTEGAAGVRVPSRGAEVVVFTIRMLLKHTSPFELVLLRRNWPDIRTEVAWLLDAESVESARALVSLWLPVVGGQLFDESVDAMAAPASTLRRITLGCRIRWRLRRLARHGPLHTQITEARKFMSLLSHRLRGSKKGLTPSRGGAVIAFVGSEASGKSTLIKESRSWLGKHYTLEQVHAGKPPSRPLTLLPNAMVPLMRRFAPEHRPTVVEQRTNESEVDKQIGPLFLLRCVSLAYDRRALLMRAHIRAANGRIVLCDRYPSTGGGPDGPQLGPLLESAASSPMARRFAEIEARMYREIPPADLVVYLTAPLETTLERNRARHKTEPEEYVRHRYQRSSTLEFEGALVRRIGTDGPLDETVNQVKKAIWDSL